jgi:hypothetical protein
LPEYRYQSPALPRRHTRHTRHTHVDMRPQSTDHTPAQLVAGS